MATSTLFSYPHVLPEGFEDRSVLIFHLKDGKDAKDGETRGAAAGQASAVDPATLSIQQLRPIAMTASGGASFQPNIVVTREPTTLSLQDFVAAQRANLRETSPDLAVLRDGTFEVAGLPAREAEVAVSLEAPVGDLVQWQVVTVRAGFGYCFFATTRKDRSAADRPRFAAFIAGWR
jgi:hypothetical protein